jgi:ADP-ribosylglycohydrolase
MLGAIAGDIIGSIYERKNVKTKYFQLFSPNSKFTDDTVLTVASADVMLNHGNYVSNFKTYYHRYPNAGYGGMFHQWAKSESTEAYNSWGNGSAMRVSPIGFTFDDLETVLFQAKKNAEVTHNHPEGIKGAQATAATIFLGRTHHSKDEIKDYIENQFGYDLSQSIDEIRPTYKFDSSCQGTVPQAIAAFLESTDFEDAIRNAVSLGGDSDTLTCITGGIAQAFYGGVPDAIAQKVWAHLDPHLSQVTQKFMTKFNLA